MLKTETKALFLILLLMQSEWTSLISYAVAVLSGLCISIGYEWSKGSLSKKTFGIKLLFVFGLCPMVYHFWNKYGFSFIDDVGAMFFSTLFSDVIVNVGYSVGKVGIKQWIQNLLKIGEKDNLKNE